MCQSLLLISVECHHRQRRRHYHPVQTSDQTLSRCRILFALPFSILPTFPRFPLSVWLLANLTVGKFATQRRTKFFRCEKLFAAIAKISINV